MNEATYFDLISANPDWYARSCSVDGDTYEGVVFYDDMPKPSESEMEAWRPRAAALAHNRHMSLLREDEFRDTTDPLFMKAQRGEVPITTWEEAVEEIRSRYPYVEVPEAP